MYKLVLTEENWKSSTRVWEDKGGCIYNLDLQLQHTTDLVTFSSVTHIQIKTVAIRRS